MIFTFACVINSQPRLGTFQQPPVSIYLSQFNLISTMEEGVGGDHFHIIVVGTGIAESIAAA